MQLVSKNENRDFSKLLRLIKNPPQGSLEFEFTPEIAEYVLSKLNLHNRPKKPVKIVQYAKDMQDKNWSITGETLKFGTDGLLKDGQNRLAACIRAQTPFRSHVIFGIDPESFHHMDTGKQRGADDVLAIMGVQNAQKVSGAMKYMNAYRRGMPTTGGGMSNQAMKDMYLNEINPDLMQEAIRVAKRVYSIVKFPMGQVAAVYYIASENGDGDRVAQFFDELCSGGSSSSKFHPPRHLVETLVRLRMDRTQQLTSHMYSVMLTRAWYNYKRKKRSLKADMKVGLSDRIMEI
jgi:hypothetical protein